MEASYLQRLVQALICLAPSFAWGQAWLPDEHTLSVNFVHNDIENNDHYLPNGDELDVGHTRVFNDAFSVAYSPSDRWLISAGIPYVRARYHGSHPHAGTHIDDGQYRGTFTDLRVELHYQAFEKPFAFAPFIASIVPTHDYPTLGHAAPGRRLAEQWVGFYLGKSLDDWLPRTYVQVRYNFAFVEKKIGVTHNRSNLDMECGYFINSKWSVRGLASWQRTHGGIDVPVPVKSRFYPYHDQLAAERYLEVGGGVAWAVREVTSVYLLYKKALNGADGHKLNNEFSLGLATSFSLGP